MSDDLEYWRTLAEERQRQLEALRARLLAAIDAVPDHGVRAFVSALDTARPAWLRELDAITAAVELEPADVVNTLDDLWRRVSSDSGE